MTLTDAKCPKCKGVMETGFIVDFDDDSGIKVSRWVEGVPEESFWSGLKVDDRRQMEIRTYRCIGCGYLESYAPEREGLLLSRLDRQSNSPR
jgi:hypothetical protein